MELADTPRIDLARATLPGPLYRALAHIFSQEPPECMLVGGTALAGFYAGHRVSNDLDIFSADAISFRAGVLAAKDLKSLGTIFFRETQSAQYYHAQCLLDDHRFTVDLVEDANLFRVGKGLRLENKIVVADLTTILGLKAAALISRCAEKDLYDLVWIFSRTGTLEFPALLALGQQYDAGWDAENLLISLSGATLREEACDFSPGGRVSAANIYREVVKFQDQMIRAATAYLRGQPVPPFGELVKRLKRLRKSPAGDR